MVKTVPVCHIQPDFDELINTEENGSFYINVDEGLDHVKEYVVNIPNSSDFRQIGSKLYCAELDGHRYKFCLKQGSYASTIPETWTCIDATDHPIIQFALGDREGCIRVLDSRLLLRHEIRGAHLDELTCLKFFPSGQVLLSGSMDMQLKIWSLADGSNPRTFRGHSSRITDVCMVERGRNFVSASQDGSIKLWETGSGLALHNFCRRENPSDGINSLFLTKSSDVSVVQGSNNLEFGTEGKNVFAGHNSGVITGYDLFDKGQIMQLPSVYMSTCESLSRVSNRENCLYAGYSNGALAQWDLRKTDKPVDQVLINQGIPINHIYGDSTSLYVSSGVDSAMKLDIQPSNGSISVEDPTFLVANDCQVSQFVAAPHDEGVIAVGNWGLCAHFK